MTKTVYTIGYAGRKPDELKAIVEEHDAMLFDIRFSPFSRDPQWAGRALTALLKDRYVHVKALGNANYKNGGPITILDYPSGLTAILHSPRPVMLLCVCGNPSTCHRTTVAGMLREHGCTVTEIGHVFKPIVAPPKPPKPQAQMTLF